MSYNFDIQPLKNDKKNNDKMAFLLHKSATENNFILFNSIIELYTLKLLLDTQHNGIISKLLEFFIHNSDNNNINYIVETCNNILMKRDYFHLICYYYNTNINIAMDIFENKISGQILSKDINYILENKLYKLLTKMEGTFVKTSYKHNIIPNKNLLKLFTLPYDIINSILQEVENETKFKINNINNNIMAIIDGGSVIHSNSGIITNNSINDLINIIIMTKETIGMPIVIIHKRHLKTIPMLLQKLKELDVLYHFTPPNINDDLFIINYFLALKTKAFIITNDKFRDHIFKYEKSNKESNKEYFKYIIQQQTLNFSCSLNKIQEKPTYSLCIQIIDNDIYIPSIDGFTLVKN